MSNKRVILFVIIAIIPSMLMGQNRKEKMIHKTDIKETLIIKKETPEYNYIAQQLRVELDLSSSITLKKLAIEEYLASLDQYKVEALILILQEKEKTFDDVIKKYVVKYQRKDIEKELGIPEYLPKAEIKTLKEFDFEIEKWEGKLKILKDEGNVHSRNSDRLETLFESKDNTSGQQKQQMAEILKALREMRQRGGFL